MLIQGINPNAYKYENHEEHIKAHRSLKKQLMAEMLGVDPDTITEEEMELIKQDPEIGIVFVIIDDYAIYLLICT